MKRFNRFILDEAAKEKLTFNRGHAYEFVLAAAMVSRFTDRTGEGLPETITPESVQQVMKMYFVGKPIWYVEEGPGKDTVEFDGEGLPDVVKTGLKHNLRHADVQDMVKKAISAVKGNASLTKLSTEVITNKKKDYIKVECAGTFGQMNTKSDINLYINRVEKDKSGSGVLKGITNVDLKRVIGYSVKYGGVGQVAQWAGVNLAKNIVDAFDAFGINVSSIVKPIEDALASTDFIGLYKSRQDPLCEKDKAIVFNATHPVFSQIGRANDERWFGDEENIKKLTAGLLKAAKGSEDDIELVRNGFSFDKTNFDALAKGISNGVTEKNVQWKVGADTDPGDGTGSEVGTPMAGNPVFQLWVGRTKIFQIRVRYDADKDRKTKGYKVRFRVLCELGHDVSNFIEKVLELDSMIIVEKPKRKRKRKSK